MFDTDTAKLLCDVTTDVQDFWTDEAPQAIGIPYQRTQTVFFSGATQTGCGPASSQTGPFYCPADQLVYFDLDFLNQLGPDTSREPDYVISRKVDARG